MSALKVMEKTGWWRLLLLLLLGCNYAIVSMNHTLPTFHGYTPQFFCQVNNVSTPVEGCVKNLDNTNESTSEPSCPQGYQFHSERNDWTVVTEWQLVCERKALHPLVTTLYFCGVTLGAVLCGIWGDRYGRRPVLLICLYVQGLLGICLYFANTLEIFMVIRFIQGFFVQGVQGTTYTLLVELFPPHIRTAVGVVLELYWAAGQMYLAAASYYIPNWRTLELVLSIPTALTLLYVCLVPESARWLHTRNRYMESQKIWCRILPRKKKGQLQERISVRKNLINNYKLSTTSLCATSGIPDQNASERLHGSMGSIKINSNLEIGNVNGKISHTAQSQQYQENTTTRDSENHSERNISIKVTDLNALKNNDINSENKDCVQEELTRISEFNEIDFNGMNKTDKNSIYVRYKRNKTLQGNDINDSTLRNELQKIIPESCAEKNGIICKPDTLNPVSSVIPYETDQNSFTDITVSVTNNCIVLNKEAMHSVVKKEESEHQKKRQGFLELFKSGVLRKYNLVMILLWFSTSLSYYGIMFHLPDLSGERHLNFLIGAILEAVSYIQAYVMLTKAGRRIPMCSYLLISGIIFVILGCVSVVPGEEAHWRDHAQIALALLGKAAIVSAFCSAFLYTSELFPTILRAAAMGHCGFWGRVGSLLAPQLLLLGGYTIPAVPIFIMGILGMIAGLLVLALPETLGRQLPDTVEEAEELAKKK